MNKHVTEKELIEKSTGERVTLDAVEAAIISEHFFSAMQGARTEILDSALLTGNVPDLPLPLDPDLNLLTICVLRLWNGFTVLGQSACADPKNFDPVIGKRLAKSDAVNKMWALMGYELKSRMARDQRLVGGSPVEVGEGFTTYIGTKVVHAQPCTRYAYNELRMWKLPEGENGDDEGYIVEYADRVERAPAIPGFQGYVSWSPKEVFERAYRPVRVAKAQPAATSAEGSGTASTETRLGEIVLRNGPDGKSLRMKLRYKNQPIGCYRELLPAEDDLDHNLLFLMNDMARFMNKDAETGHKEETWVDRAKAELAELTGRYEKLEAFLRTDAFQRLPAIDRKDLYVQVNHMEGYKHALAKRVARQDAVSLAHDLRQAQQFQNMPRS